MVKKRMTLKVHPFHGDYLPQHCLTEYELAKQLYIHCFD